MTTLMPHTQPDWSKFHWEGAVATVLGRVGVSPPGILFQVSVVTACAFGKKLSITAQMYTILCSYIHCKLSNNCKSFTELGYQLPLSLGQSTMKNWVLKYACTWHERVHRTP